MKQVSKTLPSLVFVLYFFIGLTFSGKQGFWHDEMYTLTFLKGFSIYPFEGSIWQKNNIITDVNYFKNYFLQDRFYSNFSLQILHEGHPPLYFLLLKMWSSIFGYSEIALRSFSLVSGLLSFLVLFNLVKTKEENSIASWALLAVLVLNPTLFYFFTEARMYALSFLLASLSFKFWIDYQKERTVKTKAYLLFLLSSVLLLYTHYYGLFFLLSILLFELIKYGFSKSVFNLCLPFLLFLPWALAIRKQLIFHAVHWTDGLVSFQDSLIGYFDGLTSLMISPTASAYFNEKLIMLVIATLVLLYLIFKNPRFALLFVSVILVYGLQIYLFDQLVGKHSILVPRYYILVLIFIFWGLFEFFNAAYKPLSFLVLIVYSTLASTVFLQLYLLKRAPKEMIREVAGYVDSQIDSKSTILVFEPEGPLMVGVAYYLNNNFRLSTAQRFPSELGPSAIYIDEMLGVASSENKFHNDQQKNLKKIPFVGISLYK
jgi:uncharacterized membrane protein